MKRGCFGIVALLCAGMFVLGCGGSAEDDLTAGITGLDSAALPAPGTACPANFSYQVIAGQNVCVNDAGEQTTLITCPAGYTLQVIAAKDVCVSTSGSGEQQEPVAAAAGSDFVGAGANEGGETAAAQNGETAGENESEEETGASDEEEAGASQEDCGNGLDDNNNGLIDCEDPVCAGVDGCPGGGGGAGTGSGTGPGSALSCSEVLSCIQGCGQTDDACFDECLSAASPDAQQKLQALIVCLDTCPEGQSEEDCVGVTCGAQAQACIGGGGGGGGTGGSGGSCTDIVQCIQTCDPTDQSCGQACLSQGDAEAQQLFMAFNQCASTNCAGATTEAEAQQCLTDFCSAEVNACLSGGGGGGGGGDVPDRGTGEPCGEGLTYEGCCSGNTLQWCENNELNVLECEAGCGIWDTGGNFYNCFGEGDTEQVPDPSGANPVQCQ